MKRRNFVQGSMLAGASLLTTGVLNATALTSCADPAGVAATAGDKPFNLNYGTHDGMFKSHAGDDFIEQIKFAYDKGFRAIEDNGMSGRPEDQQKKIGDTLAKLGMAMGVFVQPGLGNDSNMLANGKADQVEKFIASCKQAVEIAKRINSKLVTVVPGDFVRNLPIGVQTGNVIEAIKKGTAILEPHGVIMVLEPLSDNPDLFLRTPDQAYAICKAVGSPSCKILYDMYHVQRNQGNIIPTLDLVYDEIGYYQIGDNPGRKEPGTGEVNYKNIFKHIYNKGYRGVLGMEHGTAGAGKEGELALIKAYREADSFM
ncbi:hydroxypyruvate isomerase family protein [Mucilaginibacter dorajii]|uniref:Xylose isomerase-like TIM barrel domain-containing protein n=1 Tax=Mucilaginibacter dorajii TaxID=692994 RepID=A0ABP7QDS5_9SPHI|nr:TIM barrel protein [Mucilaginibacter dorajii]MCS3733286.1 hydroxypyruvate isomerase [Mucilaginibacter dorajii]